MASLPGSNRLLQRTIAPAEKPLDGVPLRFMLPRFSRPNRARGEGPVKMAAPDG